MSTGMDEREEQLLAEVREAMCSSWPGPRLTIETAFGFKGSVEGVRIERQRRNATPSGRSRWEQAGLVIYPQDGQTVEDVFAMLLGMRREGLADG